MYDRIYRSDKKYRVALEVLTYHSCVSEADAENALPCVIPDTIAGITRRGLEEGCTAFHMQSRDILACYAAESMRPVCSSDMPKDIRIEQLSVVPPPNAKHVIAHPILNAAEDIVGKFLVSMVVHWAQLVLESDEEHAKQLVNAERVTLFLVDQKKNELYSSILDMGNLKSANFVHDENAEIRLPLGEGIAGTVAQTGEPIRTNDAYSDPRFCRKVDETYNQVTKSVIAMPLSNGKELDKATLVRFVLTVRKNYRPVAYHNWDHGFSVAHSMYFLLKVGENHFSLLEKICLFIAALCHDLDHRGYDNRFMKKFSTPLASLYSSSPMEHHHFNMTITILQILGIIKHAILSTDLATFWASKSKLESYLDSEKGLDWTDHEQRMSVVGIAMPTCDLCAMYKPWDIQVKVVMLIMKEFWAQGDQEKASDSKPLSLMDRDEAAQLAGGQVGFIRALCLPCYTTIVRVFPQMQPIVDEVSNNLAQWEVISKQPYEERERILEEQMRQKFRKIEGRMKQ
ncbi:hypothetical protein AHF37_02314 [Paragonimus kellicotti]|nr:hypothetical protein AHF37_02314 [Paragonimus kellicotti]